MVSTEKLITFAVSILEVGPTYLFHEGSIVIQFHEMLELHVGFQSGQYPGQLVSYLVIVDIFTQGQNPAYQA